LGDIGYDGPISVEHEDPDLDPESGIEASIAGLISAHDFLAGTASAPFEGAGA
jgi:sugar phosphate isomerase/epimerase